MGKNKEKIRKLIKSEKSLILLSKEESPKLYEYLSKQDDTEIIVNVGSEFIAMLIKILKKILQDID